MVVAFGWVLFVVTWDLVGVADDGDVEPDAYLVEMLVGQIDGAIGVHESIEVSAANGPSHECASDSAYAFVAAFHRIPWPPDHDDLFHFDLKIRGKIEIVIIAVELLLHYALFEI